VAGNNGENNGVAVAPRPTSHFALESLRINRRSGRSRPASAGQVVPRCPLPARVHRTGDELAQTRAYEEGPGEVAPAL
jgi:hypothetical protein